MRKILIVGILLAGAQAPRPAFEAASIKPNDARSPLVRISMPPGRFSAVNVTLRMILRSAYNLPDFRMIGGPPWMNSDRFDIEATAGAAGVVTVDQIRAMTKALLEDRFKLKTHTETRELPIYVLLPARRDRKLGDQIHQSTAECKPMTPVAGAPPPPPPPAGPERDAAARQCPSLLGMGNISGRQFSIDRLAATLTLFVNRDVRNQTKLEGLYDLDLRWTPDQMPFLAPGAPAPPIDPDAPPLFTALQEQLGLRFDSSRGEVEVLVIDSVEKPASD